MIRGVKRDMIVLRNTGSEEFDTAYFILKEGCRKKDDACLVDEAKRILAGTRNARSKQKGLKRILYIALLPTSFLCGFLVAFLLFA